MQPVVKNLLIINVLFFLATAIFQQKGIDLTRILGLYYIGSPNFEPYQLATHFFMHASVGHIFFNMFALVIFGNILERIWGAQKFLMFYFITAIGAAFLHQLVQGIELYNEIGLFFPKEDYIDHVYNSFEWRGDSLFGVKELFSEFSIFKEIFEVPTVGASGAVYGLLMATAMLFPNTEVYLYFAIPVKMKWLALGLGAYALVKGMMDSQGDSIAHFAHLGGMLFAFILIKIWQKNKSNFY